MMMALVEYVRTSDEYLHGGSSARKLTSAVIIKSYVYNFVSNLIHHIKIYIFGCENHKDLKIITV